MAVARLEDQESYAHAYIFSQAYTPSVRELLREAADSDLPLFIEGRTEEDAGDGEDEEKRSAVLAEQVLPFGEACARSRRPAVIRVPRCLVTPEGLAGFREVLEKFPGPIAVCASIPGPGGDTLLRLGSIRVRPSPAFYEAITIWRKAGRKTVRQSRPSRKRKRRPPSQRPGYRLPPEGTEKIPAETKKAAARPERMPFPATLAALLRWTKN